MTSARIRLLVAVTVLVAIGVVGGVVRPQAHATRAARAGLAPVTTVSRVCPSVTGGRGGLATDMTVAALNRGRVSATFASLTARPTLKPAALTLHPAQTVHVTNIGGAVVVGATGAGAAGVVASQVALVSGGGGRGLSDAACLPPAADWWFDGADGRIGITDLLVMTNPAGTAANVALSMWSSKGPLSPPGVSSINVPAHGVVVRHVADLAPDAQWIAMHVHANSGTATAAIVDEHVSGIRPGGTDWIAPTGPPARTGVVTGFMSGATVDVLHLANPGARDATVALRVVTTSRNFVPAGNQTVVVPAGRTLAVNLSAAISGEYAAAAFTSDAPVLAEGITVVHRARGYDDLAWMPAQPPLDGPAGIAANEPPFGELVRLVLTSSGPRSQVTVRTPSGRSATVVVPAGRTAWVNLRSLLGGQAAGAGPVEIVPEPGRPVYAMRILFAVGAHGPLLAEEAPSALPTATTLPAVVADLRAATPQG